MKKPKSVLLATIAAAALIVGGTASSPAFASGGLIENPSDPTAQVAPSPLLAELEVLTETQAEADVQALFDSGVPAEFLVDTSGDEWELVAGIARGNPVQTYALSQLGG
ncbi:hypothetical protein [Leucobacter salsicius]|uniref:hypothetical protein n=1 Tax=Leucobacter salsicius TaxID=664638 RepID=UPI000346CF13|nr:hypothetical protein [Leucobacter salsicius]